jgi:pimeloyl-ACP methyl ester carboxylesterase
MPNSDLEVIPEAGHMVIIEKPITVTESIQNFFSNLN